MAQKVTIAKIQVVGNLDGNRNGDFTDEIDLYGHISDDGTVLYIHDDDGKLCSMDVSNFLEFAALIKELADAKLVRDNG